MHDRLAIWDFLTEAVGIETTTRDRQNIGVLQRLIARCYLRLTCTNDRMGHMRQILGRIGITVLTLALMASTSALAEEAADGAAASGDQAAIQESLPGDSR
jgi:hypothetical protein